MSVETTREAQHVCQLAGQGSTSTSRSVNISILCVLHTNVGSHKLVQEHVCIQV